MSIFILILICLLLVLHRYLSAFFEQGNLPYANGFLVFFKVFIVLVIVNLIWIFGIVPGLILSLLTFFQVIFSAFLWPFQLLVLLKEKHEESYLFLPNREPNKLLYGGWSNLIFVLLLLTIINFFYENYSSMAYKILKSINGGVGKVIIYSIIFIVIGNILRIISMKLFLSDK